MGERGPGDPSSIERRRKKRQRMPELVLVAVTSSSGRTRTVRPSDPRRRLLEKVEKVSKKKKRKGVFSSATHLN